MILNVRIGDLTSKQFERVVFIEHDPVPGFFQAHPVGQSDKLWRLHYDQIVPPNNGVKPGATLFEQTAFDMGVITRTFYDLLSGTVTLDDDEQVRLQKVVAVFRDTLAPFGRPQ